MMDLTFPEHDAGQLKDECENLRQIILHDAAAHIAWLRAIQSQTVEPSVQPHPGWEEHQIKAALKHGLYDAYARGMIKTGHLHSLAHDPDLFEAFSGRVFAEGSWEHWLASLEIPEVEDVDKLADELLGALRHQNNAEDLGVPEAPSLYSEELDRTYIAHWAVATPRPAWRVAVPVIESTTVTLSWRDRVWGMLRVARSSPMRFVVQAQTGVFLARPAPPEIGVRAAAAAVAPQGPAASGIEVSAVTDELLFEIWL